MTFEGHEGFLLPLSLSLSKKATEQYFPCGVVHYDVEMVLTFESVDEILKCDYSNESSEKYFPAMLFVMVHKAVLTYKSVDDILKCDHSNESYSTILSRSVFDNILQNQNWVIFSLYIQSLHSFGDRVKRLLINLTSVSN